MSRQIDVLNITFTFPKCFVVVAVFVAAAAVVVVVFNFMPRKANSLTDNERSTNLLEATSWRPRSELRVTGNFSDLEQERLQTPPRLRHDDQDTGAQHLVGSRPEIKRNGEGKQSVKVRECKL